MPFFSTRRNLTSCSFFLVYPSGQRTTTLTSNELLSPFAFILVPPLSLQPPSSPPFSTAFSLLPSLTSPPSPSSLPLNRSPKDTMFHYDVRLPLHLSFPCALNHNTNLTLPFRLPLLRSTRDRTIPCKPPPQQPLPLPLHLARLCSNA